MRNIISYPENLPISAEKEQIIGAIKEHPVLIIAGDTGSGKSTQLPKMCLDAGRGKKKLIGCTQPRRLAATSVAARVGDELGDLSHLVGYKIRFKDETGRGTRIKFMTDGILLAETQRDRSLNAYDTIIIDEAHERSLNIDFLLGILKKLIKKRPDLKIIITSATIDTEKFSEAFDKAPVIMVSGRTYPVEIRYTEDDRERQEEGDQESTYVEQAVQAVFELCQRERGGDMLVFMPTERDIRETVELLGKRWQSRSERLSIKEREPLILPLFGRLSGVDQNKIFRKSSTRKIVICTNVAETSVTVPGIRYVVDTGLARISSYNVRARTTKLPVSAISRASCDQRAGRCGRVGPGVCVRLFSEENYLARSEFTPPEIVRSNLAEVILRMVSLKLGSPKQFPFIDPPSPRAINDGYNLLVELEAISKKRRLTPTGKIMAHLPLDPCISRMIIAARDNSCLREVVIVAAALSIQEPRIRPAEKAQQADEAHRQFKAARSDFLSYLHLWDSYEHVIKTKKSKSALRKFCKKNFLSFQRMREWRDIHEQIWSQLASAGSSKTHHHFLKSSCLSQPDLEQDKRYAQGYAAIHQAILSGSLRNIALKKEKNIYQGGQGKELMIFPGSGQFNKGGQWIMAAELVETSRLYARTVAAIQPEWIEPLAKGLCRSSYSSPHWEKKQGQVVALEKVSLFGLVIEAGRSINFGLVKADEARRIFIQQALVEGELGGRFAFLARNQKLIAGLADLEDRMRRRDILVDDFLLYEFYDKRLPDDVFDRAGLIRFLKKLPDDALVMEKADILRTLPESDELADYPQNVHCGELSFPLSYAFLPGSDEDGVTVKIPSNLVEHVQQEKFEWLVPGLLLEKIIFLLKGLPKSVRRNLIPIPKTAEDLLAQMELFQGSLYEQLENLIYRRFHLRIDRSAWQRDALPAHLQMRYQLVNGDGKTVGMSRDLSGFASSPAASGGTSQLSSLCKKWEKGSLTDWDFDGVPERIPIKDKKGKLTGFAYPGLVLEKDGNVALRLFHSQDEQREKTTEGLRALYSMQFVKQCKALKKDIALPRSYWALYEGIASHEEFNEDLLSFVLTEIFSCRSGTIPSRQEFDKKITEVKQNGLYAPAKEMMQQVVELLRDRREVLDDIAAIEEKCRTQNKLGVSLEDCRNLRAEVASLLPPRFLLKLDNAELQRIPRYLKAMRIRLERKMHNPAKDEQKAKQLHVHEERLALFQSMENLTRKQKESVTGYRYMIEEFKVSLFAQELKTSIPISAKRLDKWWQEMRKEIDAKGL
ncbi:MAG: ATP-dependent RNA helicase HrpA [Desulfobulbaceae bacterium]|nr:ATP-dependent RNA helicase HrpA [Desulfobulbaceae bacterium]